MASLGILKTLIRELITTERSPRVNEPDLVMDDPDKVEAFRKAGEVDGVMAPVYIYHCAQISDVIKPGDNVIDLGCGPANQLGLVAKVNPDTHFTGIDLSNEMLAKADAYIKSENLSNVSLQQDDISKLSSIDDQSVDAVFSTVVLHHLPDVEHLFNTFQQVKRVLKPGGGVYIVDFAHLKSEKSINYFAYQYADRQPELFTLDYLYSLRAAFSVQNFKDVTAKYLSDKATFHSMFMLPFMVAIKSPNRREMDQQIFDKITQARAALPDYHEVDIKDLIHLFGKGGMKSQFLL